MKKVRYLSLIILVILLLYLVATALFTRLFQIGRQALVEPTRLPAPTFTPIPIAKQPTLPPIPTFTPSPSPTVTSLPSPTPVPLPTITLLPPSTPTVTPQPTPTQPQVVATQTVNLRAGPGTNYPIVSSLPPNVPVNIVGRSADGGWWQLQGPDGQTAWVANSVVQATHTETVPLVAAPPPPVLPTPSPVPSPTNPVTSTNPPAGLATATTA